jgi:TonB-dependent SusC/RagA subfamily outer membrane receptor
MPVNFIDRIDVLKSGGACAIFGLRGSNGVINIITKIGDEVIKSASVTYSANNRFSGYDVPRIFYSPAHMTNSASEYIPDLRSTLYWKPDINLVDSNNVILNYYNADNSSLIRIIAEGITTTGIPVTGQSTYEIK